jgi:hypothetical protein
MLLSHLLYVSAAAAGVNRGAVTTIHRQSAANNAKRGVTGLLLYGRGNFIQLLEGDLTVVTDLYAKVARDPRHADVRTLFAGPAERRVFPSWAMGLAVAGDVDAHAPVDRARLEAVLAAAAGAGATGGQRVLDLLKDFRRQVAA